LPPKSQSGHFNQQPIQTEPGGDSDRQSDRVGQPDRVITVYGDQDRPLKRGGDAEQYADPQKEREKSQPAVRHPFTLEIPMEKEASIHNCGTPMPSSPCRRSD
jgi:hypothetical protein